MSKQLTLKQHICIVIPCYNEENGLPLQEYSRFLEKTPEVLICFVNDGSTDKTLEVLEALKNKHPKQIIINSSSKNVGKAEAIRRAMVYCNDKYDHEAIAYLDADLSTSLQECVKIASYLNSEINFVFGSRIKKIGSIIERSPYRFFVGRIIATIISNILNLNVYDTQCGCKVFSKKVSSRIFKDPFISRWLFDVEIFSRLIVYYGREKVLDKMLEIPLIKWIDQGDSKVKATYFFKLWVDLYRINKIHKNNLKFSQTNLKPQKNASKKLQ